MQRYQKLKGVPTSERFPSLSPREAQILLLVEHIDDGHLISQPVAPATTILGAPLRSRRSSSPAGARYATKLMHPPPGQGYRSRTDAAAPMPFEVDPARHDASTTGLTSLSEQRARSLAVAYAALHANAGRERLILENVLYHFSTALLGIVDDETTVPPDKPPARDEAAEDRLSAQRVVDSLTARQRQVMVCVLAGRPNKLIAEDLHISQRTVENHRAAVMARTGSKSLPALARMGLVAGIPGEPALPLPNLGNLPEVNASNLP